MPITTDSVIDSLFNTMVDLTNDEIIPFVCEIEPNDIGVILTGYAQKKMLLDEKDLNCIKNVCYNWINLTSKSAKSKDANSGLARIKLTSYKIKLETFFRERYAFLEKNLKNRSAKNREISYLNNLQEEIDTKGWK